MASKVKYRECTEPCTGDEQTLPCGTKPNKHSSHCHLLIQENVVADQKGDIHLVQCHFHIILPEWNCRGAVTTLTSPELFLLRFAWLRHRWEPTFTRTELFISIALSFPFSLIHSRTSCPAYPWHHVDICRWKQGIARRLLSKTLPHLH